MIAHPLDKGNRISYNVLVIFNQIEVYMSNILTWDPAKSGMQGSAFEAFPFFRNRYDFYPVSVMFAVKSGSFLIRCLEEEYCVRAGEYALCPASSAIEKSVCETVSLMIIRYGGIDFGRHVLYGQLSQHGIDTLRILHAVVLGRKEFRRYMEHLMADLLYDVLVDKTEVITPEGKETPPLPEPLPEITEYITANPDADLSIAALSQRFGCSPASVNRLFDRYIGIPPHRFVLQLRLTAARSLLTESDLPVQTIAQRCGWSSAYYFSAAFRKECGISPSGYRLNWKGNRDEKPLKK